MAKADFEKLVKRIEQLENRCAQFDLHFMSFEQQIKGPGDVLGTLKKRIKALENNRPSVNAMGQKLPWPS